MHSTCIDKTAFNVYFNVDIQGHLSRYGIMTTHLQSM